MSKMSKKLLIGLLLFALIPSAGAKLSGTPLEELTPKREHRQTTMIITRVINKYHYNAAPIDDRLSSAIFDRYLESLDPNKNYFTQQDINHFERHRERLDDAIRSTDLTPAFEIFRVYRVRVNEMINYALGQLDREFDFTIPESYRFDRKEAPWAADHSELRELWRQRVKNDILSLRLTDKAPEEINETLRKRYERTLRRTNQFDADDVYHFFINAFTLSIEPHTAYMPPRDAENFDINMRLSLEGIGAVLRSEDEYTTIQKVIQGGPAALSREVHAGDRVLAVGQGKRGEMEDVIGWRLQDVVDQIRGPKGSTVRLRLLPAKAGSDGPSKVVTLERNEIKLEEQAARKQIIEELEGLKGYRIGVIEVPTFYRDFQGFSRGDADFRSTTRDVRLLLEELVAAEVDGVLIDLRGNGGGSLTEATELTGLFIPGGPVVQVRKATGELDIEQDLNPEVAYSGPLAVLVDRSSASASEIFAAAIQDYGRGIVIGETTFGKGTVQTLLNLDRFMFLGSGGDLGRLRLTMAQFYRINGGSTQYKGVIPDIPFPTDGYGHKVGERALDNALPWTQIAPTDYRRSSSLGDLSRYLERHRTRTASDPGFRFLLEEEEALRSAREEHTLSLVKSERQQEWKERQEQRLERLNRFREAVGLPPESPESRAESNDDPEAAQASLLHPDSDSDDPEEQAIRKIAIHEAARILGDLISDASATRAAMVE